MLNGESHRDQLRQGLMGRMEYKINGDESDCLAPHKASLPPQGNHYRKEEPCRLDNCYSPMPLGGDADRTLLYLPLKTPVLIPYEPHVADAMHATTSVSDSVQQQTSEMDLRKMNEDKYPMRYMQDDLRKRQLQHQQQVRQLQERITSLRQQDQALGFQMAYHQQEHGQVAEHAMKPKYLLEQQCTETLYQHPVGYEVMQDGCVRRENMQDRPTLEEMPGRLSCQNVEDRLAPTQKIQHGPACAEKMQNRLRREKMQDRPTLEEMPGRPSCQDVEDRLAHTKKLQHGPACAEKMQHRLRREKMQDRPTLEEMPGRLSCQNVEDRLAHTEKVQHGLGHAENMQNHLLGKQMEDCVMRERLELDVPQDQQTYEEILKSLSHEKARHFLQWESEQNCPQCKTQESLRHAEMQDRFIQRKMAEPNPKYYVQHEIQTEMGDGFSRNSNLQYPQMPQQRMQDRMLCKELQDRYTQKQTQEHFSINSQEKHLKQQPMGENFAQQRMQHRRECEEQQDKFAQEHLPKRGNYSKNKTQQQLNEAAVQENTMQDYRQTIIDGLTPKGVIKKRKVVLFEDQVTERGAQDQAGNPTSSEMYSNQRINEEDAVAAYQFPVEVKIEYTRTQSPNFEISIGGSSCSLMESHEKLSICTGVSKGTAHNLRKIVLSKCKLYNVIDSALKNLSDQDKEDNYKRNSQKYASQHSLATQSSDLFEFGDVSLPSSRIYQYHDPQISHTACNVPTTPQPSVAPVLAPGEFLCRCSSVEPNMAQIKSKLANELLAHLEPPHVPHLCKNFLELSKSEFVNSRTGEPFHLSFDDVVQSKVITPIVTKLQQMYLHTLQDQATAILELQTLPQRMQDVYKASKAHTCKEMQHASQPK